MRSLDQEGSDDLAVADEDAEGLAWYRAANVGDEGADPAQVVAASEGISAAAAYGVAAVEEGVAAPVAETHERSSSFVSDHPGRFQDCARDTVGFSDAWGSSSSARRRRRHVPPAPAPRASSAEEVIGMDPRKNRRVSPAVFSAAQDHPQVKLEEEPLEQPQVFRDDKLWHENALVVRGGQVHIELQNRNPPLEDRVLISFCEWLYTQLPRVIATYPYVLRSGADVDLSDNKVGPAGLDHLFRVLRENRVPCVVLKAYRNVLTDSIVDTLIEYLYTQPEAFPMHGIHISHNEITAKGAMRLMKAAATCGHYPRFTSRLPLWLRLEFNSIDNPQKIIANAISENVTLCLLKDGLCSRANCDHYLGVHVQLPYFLNQFPEDPLVLHEVVRVFRVTPDPAVKVEPTNDQEPTLFEGATASAQASVKTELTSAAETDGSLVPFGLPTKDSTSPGWAHPQNASSWGSSEGGTSKGGNRRQLWLGRTLQQKVKVEVKLSAEEFELGFAWICTGDGQCPQVTGVDPASIFGKESIVGFRLLRVNGLDTSLFNSKQIADMLKQRPVMLRFGDE